MSPARTDVRYCTEYNRSVSAASTGASFMVPSLRAGWVALPAYRKEGAFSFRHRGHGAIVASARMHGNPRVVGGLRA